MANMRTNRRTRSLPALEITVDINQFITLPPSQSLTVKAKIYVQNFSIYSPYSSQLYSSIPTYFAGVCLSPIIFSIENEITECYVTIRNTRKYISFSFDRLTLTSIKARPAIDYAHSIQPDSEETENSSDPPEKQEKTSGTLNPNLYPSPSTNKDKGVKLIHKNQDKTKNSLNSILPPPLPFDKQNPKSAKSPQEKTEQGETRQSPPLTSEKSTPRPVLLNLSPLTEDKKNPPETRHSIATNAMTQSLQSAIKNPSPSPSPALNNCEPNLFCNRIMYPVALFSALAITALIVNRNR